MFKEKIPFHYSNIGGKKDSFQMYFYFDYVIRVWIHDSKSPPKFDFYNDYSNYFLISPNSRSQLIVEKKVETRLGIPYNDCFKDVSLFPFNKTIINYILNQNETYDQIKCFDYCSELIYLENEPCNCSNATFDNVWVNCIGTVEHDYYGCTNTYRTNFFNSSVLEKCSQYCPLECDSISYSVTFNSATDSFQPKNLIYLDVFYKSLKYTSITQSPKTEIFDLISNVGGIFGLFIGVSFVSLFEIGELIIEFSWNSFFKNKRVNYL
jgi:hypothetical protein